MADVHRLSRAAFERLEAEYEDLTTRGRIDIARKIETARELGDLSENGDYHAAREEQGMDEAEIARLEKRLAEVKVVDETTMPDDIVFIGATVRIREIDSNDEDVVKLVGEPSEDPLAEPVEVTATSPMGEALMKARVGETVRVDTPRGAKRFEIMEIL